MCERHHNVFWFTFANSPSASPISPISQNVRMHGTYFHTGAFSVVRIDHSFCMGSCTQQLGMRQYGSKLLLLVNALELLVGWDSLSFSQLSPS